jgi:hypothetical protein
VVKKVQQPKAWRFARNVLRVAAVVLCFGVFLSFLSLPATESEVPSAFGMGNMAHVDQETNGNAPPLDGTYLLALAEEAEDTVQRPVNADLLTMLLLAASCLAPRVGWLLTNTQRQGAFCSLGVVHPSLVTSLEDRSFLGVFRL